MTALPPPRKAEPTAKAARILDAARDAFFEHDYDAVTMDEVARRAGVVKQTVYTYYASKDALYSAVYQHECREIGRLLSVSSFTTSDNVPDRLSGIGHDLLEILLSPSFRALTRATIAAARRFPSLGKSIYDGTIEPFLRQLATILQDAMDSGLLRHDDPLDAALQLTTLFRGELFFHCLFDPDFMPSQAAKNRQVAKAVDCFIAKYGTAAVLPLNRRTSRS